MEVVLWVVALNWLSPLLLWLYPLTMMLVFDDFAFDGFYGPYARFRLRKKSLLEPWHAKLWRSWSGVGLYGFMCYRTIPGRNLNARDRLIKHEAAHCTHWLLFGLSFLFLYNAHMLWIWVTQKVKGPPYTKHPYYDCWSERLARKAAGQRVNIKAEDWPSGKDDLWPWW